MFTIGGNFSLNADLPAYVPGETDNMFCLAAGAKPGNPNGNSYLNGLYPVEGCHYTDPNPIGSLNDEGHNYFLSKNPYKLISYAVFGEAYYQVTDALKVTAGLRWTVDKKEAPRVPSWLLATESFGYPVAQVIEQEWREPTGRLAVDWKPNLPFTDETMVYFSYAHGYKAGGANPPPYVRAIRGQIDFAQAQLAESETKPKIFDAEFVDAFEIGAKNTLLDGALTANLAAFYYDYNAYQISEIVDRSAFNRNFDATVWGVELEVDWRPLENLKFGVKGGYQKTRIADGERAIDLMDRTAGDPRWVLARPFPTYASSCILPAWLLVGNTGAPGNPEVVNARGASGGFPTMCEYAYDAGLDPVTAAPYVANPGTHSGVHNGPIDYAAWSTDLDDYPGAGWPGGVIGTEYPGWDPSTAPNNGEGIFKDLSGNELPNAPQWTATITADYTIPLPNEWLATLHTDLHWQAESWWRVFNDHEYSRLDEYFTMNLAAIFTNEDAGWNIMAYIKNVTDETAITGAFLNSDDTGLTTNVFLTEPRLYGIRATKAWAGVPWLDGFDEGRGPFPLTVELGGQVQRQDAPYEAMTPSFASVFPAALNVFDQAQNEDLDTGDGRSIRVTYRPNGSSWSAAAAIRYGRTNGDTHRRHADLETDPTCGFAGPSAGLCDKYVAPGAPYSEVINTVQNFTRTNFADSSAKDREEHEFIDFVVGKDVSLGTLNSSRFGLGIRYANLESSTQGVFAGVPNWDLVEGWAKYASTHSRYTAEIAAERDFAGSGPMLSWDASLALLGDDDTGHAMVDWSINSGVLFGRQETAVLGEENGSGYSVTGLGAVSYWTPPISTEPALAISFNRSTNVTVPFAGLSAGLSYEIQRLKIGAGYRWERYFDVLDVGYDEHKDADRTIDGPYFKIAVGFGG